MDKSKRFIKSYGVSNNFVKKSSDKDDIFINKVKWIGKYDGKKADIDLDINNNGEKKHYDIELNNEQIKDLLNIHSVDKPLEDRLLEDYLSESRTTIAPTNVEELISYKIPTSVSASASKRSSSKSKGSSSKRSKSSKSSSSKRSKSSRRLPTNVSRLRTSVSHSRGSLNKSKRSKSSR